MNIFYLPNLLIILPTIAAVCFAIAAVALFFDEKRVKNASIPKTEYDTVSRQEEISKSVLEGLADGILLIDATLSIPFINSSAKKLLHIRNEQPTFLDIVNALPPTLDLEKRLRDSLMENKSFDEDIKLEEKSLKLSSTPIALNEEEKPGLIYLVIKDVTFDKSLTQVKDDFVNMMIHELRAPITAVKGASEMLLAQNKLNKEESEKMTHLIHEQAARLLDQVSSLLDLAKIQASKFTIQKTPSDIQKLVNQVIEVFQIQARNKNITLSAKFDPSIPKVVTIDPIRIGQVLNNLLSNSIKFTPEKGNITISASVIKGTPQNLSISVTDTGMGIPKDQQKHLFTKFYEVADGKNAGTSNNHVAGTGLGLFITKQIIDAHGGTIQLESDEGKGTTITLNIPLLTL